MNLRSTFSRLRVLVVGDVMLDEHIQGRVRRLSPEAPVPIVEIQSRRFHPGGAGNVAANVTSLGGSALLVGVIGGDVAADRLTKELCARGVAPDYLVTIAGRSTTTKSRVMAAGHHIVRFDDECRLDLAPEDEERLAARAAECVRNADVCVISDYAKGVLTPKICSTAIEIASARGIPTVVDPKGIDYEKYAGVTVITPNLTEAFTLAGTYDGRFHGRAESPALIEDIAATIMARCDANLLITRGADGMSLFEHRAKPITIQAQARQVYDITGAGDTVVATLAMGLAAGLSLENACRLGNLAAGIVVAELGASTISLEALESAMADERSIFPRGYRGRLPDQNTPN